jgi:hypothetical protein
MPIQIPLSPAIPVDTTTQKDNPLESYQKELEDLTIKDFTYPQYESGLNIPLSHEVYNRFTTQMDKIGTNAHTASKPYRYTEVQPYYDFKEENEALFYH